MTKLSISNNWDLSKISEKSVGKPSDDFTQHLFHKTRILYICQRICSFNKVMDLSEDKNMYR